MSESEQSQPNSENPNERPATSEHQNDNPAGAITPSGAYQQDWWENCWDQPRVLVPPTPESSWTDGYQPPETGYQPQPAGYQPQPGFQPQPTLPTPGYYPPGEYPPPAGYQVTFMPYPTTTPKRRRRTWILGAAAAVLLVLFGGGGFAAYEVLNGGGVQPEQVVPASTVAFFKIDLNPSASQKINTARLLHRLPKLGGLTGSGDWRRQMFQALAGDGSLPPGLSYDRDIKPWLGERAAIAVLPESSLGSAQPLFVLQSSDNGKARKTLAKVGVNNVDFYRGYAVIAATQAIADKAVADAKAASLGISPTYRADFKSLGASGLAAGWVDLSAASSLAGGSTTTTVTPTGRMAFTIRTTPNAIDLVGRVSGMAGGGHSVASPDLGVLPASTALALGAGYDGTAIDRNWKQFQDLLDQSGGLLAGQNPLTPGEPDPLQSFEQEFGLRLPADLSTVLGTGVTVSMAADGFSTDSPKFAVRTHTNGPAAARVLDRIRRTTEANGEDFPLIYQASPDGLTMSDDRSYLASLGTTGKPTLAGLKSFHSALPEASGATIVAFVNIDAVVADARSDPANADDVKALSAFSAFGLTLRTSADSATLHVRLLAH